MIHITAKNGQDYKVRHVCWIHERCVNIGHIGICLLVGSWIFCQWMLCQMKMCPSNSGAGMAGKDFMECITGNVLPYNNKTKELYTKLNGIL